MTWNGGHHRRVKYQIQRGGMTMYVTRYQWVWTYWGYQLMPVTVFVPVYYTPVVYYYW
jgi:hypothetical protein